jgi:glycosyltransferase involved in cell wall biosynthesis
MRIAHVTTVHPRDDIRIFHKECVSLARAGFETHLIVGDGLGDALRDGVQIHDIGAAPVGRLARMREQPRRALEAVRRLDPASVHFHDPELLRLGVHVAREGRVAIYDAHEDVPRQILTKQWIPALLRRPLSRVFERYENALVRRLSAVVAATPHIERRFLAVQPRAISVCNYPLPQELSPPAGEVPRENAVCYVGGITRTRGIRELMAALDRLPDLQLILCGKFEDAALEGEVRSHAAWSRVDYRGQVGRDGVRDAMARSRAGMVTLLPMPSYMDALPIKMFEYMSAGLPVVASNFPLWREIVDDAGCGVCVDPLDAAAVAAAIAQLLASPDTAQRMGIAGREAVAQRYNWPHEERALVEFYRRLLG